MSKILKLVSFIILICLAAYASSYITKMRCIKKFEEKASLLNGAMERFQFKVNGLIHIGAHEGEEAEFYKKLKINNVIWIEAEPGMAAALEKKIGGTLGNKVFSFAASNQNGEASFMRTAGSKASSSLLDIHLIKNVHKEVLEADRITVQTKKMDDFLSNLPDNKLYNALVIDTQGAELLVLQGASETLKQIDFIISEVEYIELYKNSALISDVDAFLLDHGFLRVDTKSQSYAWGDALYVRKSKLDELASN